MFSETLKTKQPIVYQIITNALASRQIAHAYLFTGPKGSKMLEAAKWFASTLVCPEAKPYACEHCDVCRRIEEETFADLIVLDGMSTSIKKDDILNLQERFSKTALEGSGKKFYILNGADNATPEALTSLLKFLEEPSGQDTYAFLISEKPERLLETIVSRCQTLVFRAQNRQELMNEVEETDLDPYELNLISQIVNDKEEMITLLQSDDTKHSLNLFGLFIEEYSKAPYLGELFMQNHILKKKESPAQERARLTLFLNIGMMFFKDVMFQTETTSSLWKKRMNHLPKNFNTLLAFTLFNDSMHKISTNANLSLVIDALLYQLKEDKA